MSQGRFLFSFIPPPGTDSPMSLLKIVISFAMVLVVMAGVIVLIISGHLTPAIAVGTVSAACYVGIEVGRRLVGRPPTQLGSAIEAGARAFFGSLPHSSSLPLDAEQNTRRSSDSGQITEETGHASP